MTAHLKWIRSASWDGLWIMSGLWLLPLGVLFYYSPWSKGFLDYLLIAGPLVGGLHSFFPLIAVVTTGAVAERLRPQRQRVVVVGVLIVLVSMMFGILGSWLGRPEFWLVLGYGYLLWNTWHFSAQNFGVLSLYRSVQNQSGDLDRKVDKYFSVLMGCLIQPLIWFCVEARWGPFVRWIPQWIPVNLLSKITLVGASVLTLVYLVWEIRKKNRSYQKMAYAFSMGLQPFAGIWAYYPFHFLAYSLPHWMVEIGITGTIHTEGAKKSSPSGFVMKVAGFLILSLLLIYWLEPSGDRDSVIFEWWGQLAWNEVSREGLYLEWTLPTLISFFVVSRSFLHFYLSRQIYKSTRWTLGKLNSSS